MDPGEIYAKTEEGLRELKERKRGLPITLRGLLIMVDGTRTVAEILQRARALHLDKSALAELENAGLITRGREAQRRPRRLDAKPLAEATRWLEGYREFWEGSFERLDILLDEMKNKGRKRARRKR